MHSGEEWGDRRPLRTDLTTIDCTPYRCTGTEGCLEACGATGDCVTGYLCDADGHCVSADEGGDGADEGGCSCTLPGRNRSDGAWLILVLAPACGVRRRRAA